MQALEPPIEHRRTLLALARLSDDEFGEVLAVLRSLKAFEPVGNLKADTGLIREIEDMLYAMHEVRAEYELDPIVFADLVVAGLDFADEPPFVLGEKLRATARLKELLSSEVPFGKQMMERHLAADHAKVLKTSEILTDIRPLFELGSGEEPDRLAVIHTLKFGYYENGVHRELFLAANGADLNSLREALDLATARESTLVRVMQRAGLKPADLG